ncbi:MAG: sulfatase-like hydrolase/transferase, partial [Clostridia bacterium]|nr:sulfatase-like hydrolase/transferase [Clostridia bacterium]
VSTEDDYLRTYCATVMDFDKAIGYMMEELSSKNLLGNTTICMYSDHNTYYNNLSYHAKGIELDDFNEELYRIPCLIYDQKLRQAMVDNGETVSADNVYHSATVIDKFTTTSDLIPTLLDIFGIKGWDNLYFGSSVFTDKESIIYSRAYSLFVTDEFIGYSLNGELWSADNFDKADFIARAEKHLNKLELIDKVYYGDYFDSHEYKKP